MSKPAPADAVDGEADAEFYVSTKDTHHHSRRLHIRRECPRVKPETELRPATRDEFPDKELCSVCSGQYEPHTSGGSGPHTTLAKLSPEDVGLGGGGA